MHIKTELIAIPHQSKIKIFDSFPPGEALGAPAPQQLTEKLEFDFILLGVHYANFI